MILQRYTFGSKSQHIVDNSIPQDVAYDIAKIYIWKQITTLILYGAKINKLFMILQR